MPGSQPKIGSRKTTKDAALPSRAAAGVAAPEIDLILRDGAALIFVEVKQSRSFARAAESLSARQMQRIYRSAEEFLAGEPAGSLTEVRFDVALVDGQEPRKSSKTLLATADPLRIGPCCAI